MTTVHIVYFVSIILVFAILMWWRHGCSNKFPTRGHVLIMTLVACVPILGTVLLILLIGTYGVGRFDGSIKLKENKFNNFWFE